MPSEHTTPINRNKYNKFNNTYSNSTSNNRSYNNSRSSTPKIRPQSASLERSLDQIGLKSGTTDNENSSKYNIRELFRSNSVRNSTDTLKPKKYKHFDDINFLDTTLFPRNASGKLVFPFLRRSSTSVDFKAIPTNPSKKFLKEKKKKITHQQTVAEVVIKNEAEVMREDFQWSIDQASTYSHLLRRPYEYIAIHKKDFLTSSLAHDVELKIAFDLAMKAKSENPNIVVEKRRRDDSSRVAILKVETFNREYLRLHTDVRKLGLYKWY